MSARNKAHRLLKEAHYILWARGGVSQSELARRMGVARYQIQRDLSDLTALFPIYEEDGTKRLRMNKVLFRRWWGKREQV